MLIEAQTVISVGSWFQTGALGTLLAIIGSLLVYQVREAKSSLAKDIQGVKEDVSGVKDDVKGVKTIQENMRLEMANDFRKKGDCPKATECPQERRVAPQTKDLTTGVNKINTDLAVLTNDIENLRTIAAGSTLNKATA